MNDIKILRALKNKILSLAMQGKLVKQNEADEPASVLLEKIKNEKAELLKQGKLKKEKPLPPIIAEEVPYELPKSWQWVRLGEVCEIINGDRSSKYPSESDIKQVGIPFINAKNIINNKILLNTIKNFITIEKFQTLNSGKLLNNDIVFVLRGSVGKHGIFYTNNQYNTGFINAQLVILRPMFLNEKYLNLMFDARYFIELLEDKSTGSTVKQMPDNVLSKLLIPIPPLAEQERIVAKIEEIFAIIDEVENNISENKKISKVLYNKILSLAMQGKLVNQNENDEPASVLLEKIRQEKQSQLENNKKGKSKGKEKPLPPISAEEMPYELPKSWQWVKLGEISYNISAKPYQINTSEVKIYGLYKVISQGEKFIEGYSNNEQKLFKIESPIILFGDHTKNVKYIDFDFIVGADGTKLLCPYSINSKFFYYLIEYASQIISYRGYARHFNLLSQFIFPLPPQAEQERIVAKIEEIKEIIDDMG